MSEQQLLQELSNLAEQRGNTLKQLQTLQLEIDEYCKDIVNWKKGSSYNKFLQKKIDQNKQKISEILRNYGK